MFRSATQRRRWLIVAGALTLGAVLTAGALRLPPVQLWLLQRAVSTKAGWRVDFQKFSADPGGVESNGLAFAMPGLEARAEPLNIRLHPLALLRRGELHIAAVEVEKLRITLTPSEFAPSAPAAPRAPFRGVLPLLQSPLAWSLQKSRVDAIVEVQEGKQALGSGQFRVSGGGLTAQESGRFAYEFAADSFFFPPGPEHRVESAGSITVTQNDAHGIARIELSGDLRLPRYGPLALPAGRFAFSVEATEHGERYRSTMTAGALVMDFSAELDTTKTELAGSLHFRGDDSLLAALLGESRPALGAEGDIRFTCRLDNYDLDATVAATFSGGDWAKLHPDLAATDRLGGRLDAALSRRAGRVRLERASLAIGGATTNVAARLELTAPVPLPDLPSTPIARLSFDHWPLVWLNASLEKSGLQVAGAEFAGEWSVALAEKSRLKLTAVRPATIAPLRLTGGGLPALPELRIAFSPALDLTAVAAELRVPDFTLTGGTGDRLDANVTVRHDFAAQRTQVAAEVRGSLPTLLTGPEKPLPFSIAARAEAGFAGDALDLQRAQFQLFAAPGAPPALALDLLRPMKVSTTKGKLPAASPDFLRLRFGGVPLDWIGRWLPAGWEIAGTLGAGESLVRQESDSAFGLRTPAPWEWTGARLLLGGREFFDGVARIAPELKIDAATAEVKLGGIVAQDSRRNRITGAFSATAGRHDNALAAQLTLEADFPELEHSAGAFGPLKAVVSLAVRRFDGDLFATERFEFSVRNAERELVSLTAGQPFLAGFNAARVFSVGTTAPLQLRTGEIPLAWLRPWLPPNAPDGVLEPAEFLLAAEIQKYRVRPVRPLKLRNFSAGPADAPLVREVDLAMFLGADVELHLNLLPKFAMAYRATLHGNGGELDVAGQRAADLDFAFQLIGDDKRVLPQTLDLTLRADLGVMHALPVVARNLPAAGNLVLRASGDLLGHDPLEIWARLSGVPSADAKRVLTPLELSAHGKVDASVENAHAAFDIALRFDDPARPSDLAFQATLSPQSDTLNVASALRSARLDLAELIAWQAAFTAPVRAAKSAALAGKAPARPGSVPPAQARAGPPPAFWGAVRGSFELDVGSLEFAPYRIDRVRGRIQLTDREFAVDGLQGEMFAGQWGGQVRVRHDPAATVAAHALDAQFHIDQFESARVVQTVFRRELSHVEAKLDVEAAFTSAGDRLPELIERATGGFTARTRDGVVRLTLPNSEMTSSLAVLGGAVTFSPELRALGRLLPKFAEMPVDELRISGQFDAEGEVRLSEFVLNSPQARFVGRGRIAATAGAMMSRPLELSLTLAAKDEMAVILGGMNLLEHRKDAAGFRAMHEKLVLGGKAGAPDLRPLYDLLARSVSGSTGTWGMLMRKVQAEVEKKRAKKGAPPPP